MLWSDSRVIVIVSENEAEGGMQGLYGGGGGAADSLDMKERRER
jgi:hypothetical protein